MVGLLTNADTPSLQRLHSLVQPELWQQKQWQKMVQLGLPGPKDDAWKYTSLVEFEQLPLQTAACRSDDTISYESLSLNLDSYRLVFLDGRLLIRCSDWIPKVDVTPLSKLSDIERHGLRKGIKPDAFTYLSDATATSGVWLDVEPNNVINKPIYLLHISSGIKGEVCSYRHHVNLGHLSECEVIEHHISLEQGGGVTFSRLTCDVGDGARFYHTKLIEESSTQHHFSHNDLAISRDACAFSNTFLLSGLLCRHQTSSHLMGENGQVEINSLSTPEHKQTFDTRTYTCHQASHCRSEQQHKTLATEQSNGVFEGMIYVTPDAIKTDGQMDCHGLLLSKQAQINSKPQLEIYADDVKCSHGATTGQIDPLQIDYMRARGISKSKAIQMLTLAFASDVALKIRHPLVRQYVCDTLENRLAREKQND